MKKLTQAKHCNPSGKFAKQAKKVSDLQLLLYFSLIMWYFQEQKLLYATAGCIPLSPLWIHNCR